MRESNIFSKILWNFNERTVFVWFYKKKIVLIFCGLTFYHTDANVTPVSIASNKEVVLGQKFTTSNFTESIVVSSDPVFGSNGNSKPGSNLPVVKKRKLESSKSNITDDMIRYCKAKESHTAVTEFDSLTFAEQKKTKAHMTYTQNVIVDTYSMRT